MEVHHYKSLLNKVAETSSNSSIDFKNGISLYYEDSRCNPSERKNLWKKNWVIYNMPKQMKNNCDIYYIWHRERTRHAPLI